MINQCVQPFFHCNLLHLHGHVTGPLQWHAKHPRWPAVQYQPTPPQPTNKKQPIPPHDDGGHWPRQAR